ncbi:hypothetical protein GLAREA_10023 [Glarea lozoyensis ATCC 20868]|uniref:Uncharacterized protein n=1 Tax=Glarea lozoyensis (strain ATCC 20868 / MF5171) TaxID=1116229 RepID=S3DB63_GLAL2|nr:uncharacterized protein GLAREA_10023 [Glarea lozoyensis ATCC 20868]EPE34329.1 hypothetical protein GLAREA_10023 [Glarea lozoyensis ATCC 20868]
MTPPVSVGDVYLMGKLALKLGRAFTKGRKSAPAEFHEVENQLYSLSIALNALEHANSEGNVVFSLTQSHPASATLPEQTEPSDSVGVMVRSCEQTLKHLETIVEKYSDIGKSRESGEPILKRWKRTLKDNWKKVAWTTEGGDLATLRSQLAVHINSLNLVLGVVNNSQTVRLEDNLEKVSTMLREIHVWFVENLKETTSPTQREVSISQVQNLPSRDPRFELYVEADQGLILLCNCASLHPKWNERPSDNIQVSENLFKCCCPNVDPHNDMPPHQEKLATYGLSPLSFPLKLMGKVRSWMLYKATEKTTNRLVSLIIKKVPLRIMTEFEETFIQEFGAAMAGAMLSRGLSTMLAHFNPATHEWRILHLTGDTTDIQKSVDTVTFSVGQRSYTRGSIEAIKLLHYKALSNNTQNNPPNAFCYVDSAEIAVFFDEQESEANGDINSTTLHIRHDTQVLIDESAGNVKLKSVECTGLGAGENSDIASCADVVFKFTTTTATKQFNRQVGEMTMELFVMHLQSPRKNEKCILKLQASQVRCEVFHMSDAEISIVSDTTKNRPRLIIVSHNGCSIAVADDFTTSLQTPGQRPNFASPTYLVQIEESGAREVHHYKRGFEYLDFSSVQNGRLFELGLATLAAVTSGAVMVSPLQLGKQNADTWSSDSGAEAKENEARQSSIEFMYHKQQLASQPAKQFAYQLSLEEDRLGRRTKDVSEIARESVKASWVQQGLWRPSFEQWMSGAYFYAGRWKHELPPDAESDDSDVDGLETPLSKGEKRRKREPTIKAPKATISNKEDVTYLCQLTAHDQREASRPYHQFLYQMSKAQERSSQNPPDDKVVAYSASDYEVNTRAYNLVKASWMRQGIWCHRWGILPGMSWKHELAFDILGEEADYLANNDQLKVIEAVGSSLDLQSGLDPVSLAPSTSPVSNVAPSPISSKLPNTEILGNVSYLVQDPFPWGRPDSTTSPSLFAIMCAEAGISDPPTPGLPESGSEELPYTESVSLKTDTTSSPKLIQPTLPNISPNLTSISSKQSEDTNIRP